MTGSVTPRQILAQRAFAALERACGPLNARMIRQEVNRAGVVLLEKDAVQECAFQVSIDGDLTRLVGGSEEALSYYHSHNAAYRLAEVITEGGCLCRESLYDESTDTYRHTLSVYVIRPPPAETGK